MRTILVVAFILSVSHPALAESSRFPSLGFSVAIPDGQIDCAPFDNGIAFYLDGKPVEPGCDVKPNRRMITFTAEENSSGLAGASSFAAQQCMYVQDRWKSFPPVPADAQKYSTQMPTPSLDMGGHTSWSCYYSGNDGDDLFVTAECAPPTENSNRAEIDCGAWLHTEPRYFDRDLVLFRSLIASLQLIRPKTEATLLNVMGTAGSCPSRVPSIPYDQEFKLQDPRTGLLLQIERDGRTISAFSADGKILWKKDPFVDAHLEPYRVPHPVIARFGILPDCAIHLAGRQKWSDHFVSIEFNSSQMGVLDARTGHFIFLQQN